MNIRSTIIGSAAALVVAGTVATAVPASAAPSNPAPKSATATCTPAHDDHRPAYTYGRPHGLDAGDRGGVYLWHDTACWHLRVTHRNDHVQVYSGTIATTGGIRFQRVADERADQAWVGPDHHTLHFVFTNFGRMDGVDFQTVCAPSLAMNFRGDGIELPAGRVNIGVFDVHPAKVPFVISRVG